MMLRLRPTTVSLTATELREFELRRRFMQHLRTAGAHREPVRWTGPVDAIAQEASAIPAAIELSARSPATEALSKPERASCEHATEAEQYCASRASPAPPSAVPAASYSTRVSWSVLHAGRRETGEMDESMLATFPDSGLPEPLKDAMPLDAEVGGGSPRTDDGLSSNGDDGDVDDDDDNDDDDEASFYAELGPQISLPSTSSRTLRSTVGRFLSRVRSLGIRGHGSTEDGPLQKGSRSTEPDTASTTRLPVYDDSLPEASQPQNANHLPESRHQSRVDGAIAASADRLARPQAQVVQRRRTPVRPVASRHGDSPVGLTTPGFQGLYGGIENTDEETLYYWRASET